MSEKQPSAGSKPTVKSLAEGLSDLEVRFAQLDKQSSYKRSEQERINGGTTKANARAARLERKLGSVENRLDEDENAIIKILSRLSMLAGISQSTRADVAFHEERISQVESHLSSRDNIVGVWAITICLVEAFVLASWLVLKNWHNGLGQRLNDSPSYDGLFIWLAVGAAVVITLTAILIGLFSPRPYSRHEIHTSESDAEISSETHVDTVVASSSSAKSDASEITKPYPVVATN